MLSRSRFPALALALIGSVGVGISIYLTTVHYAGVPLVCSASGIVNCERVLTSGYSTVLGVPVSVGGIVWFALTGILGLIGLLRSPEPPELQPAQVIWSLLGLAAVIYLVGVEALALGVICAWCTSLHALIVITLLMSVLRTPASGAEPESIPGSETLNPPVAPRQDERPPAGSGRRTHGG